MKMLTKTIAVLALVQMAVVAWASDKNAPGEALLENGEAVYMGTCFACHGLDGKGLVPGTPNLRGKKSPLKQEDAILKERIINGYQSKGSPMAMPPLGGNPGLTDEEVDAVIAYMKNAFLTK